MSWLSRHAPGVEAGAAIVTACVAVAALIGVKWQLDEADRLSALQSAREAYRSHLALAVSAPQFAAPRDGCALLASDQAGAYRAFVDHLLYAAEQMLDVEQGWEPTFQAQLEQHGDYICSADAPQGETGKVQAVVQGVRRMSCPARRPCP